MYSVLVTGANRGIGLEFCRQYSRAGCQVLACCRHPDQAVELQALAAEQTTISLYQLDVCEQADIDKLAAQLAQQPVDLLINNAGYYGPSGVRLGAIDVQQWLKVFAINAIAPLKVAEALVDSVAKSELKTIAFMSSKMGSMADNGSGGSYLYRSSKAGLNAVVKSLSIDLADRGIKVAALHPGWVKTAMGGPNALIDASASVTALRQLLARLTPQQSGHFFNYDGTIIPW
jgi:NAD(P)-dependent dehydrogenase (short-subunit alcohol dehydrogenase family)